MESTSLARPTPGGSKGLLAKNKVRKTDKEHSVDKPRSLSRQKVPMPTKTRLEDSKILVATPRGSLLEQYPTTLSSLGSSKMFKLLNLRKEKFFEEAGSARATANPGSGQQSANYMPLQFNIQNNGLASSAGFIGTGGSTKKSSVTSKMKTKKEVLHTLGPVPTKTVGFTRESKSRDRDQFMGTTALKSPVEFKAKYDLRTSLLNAGMNTLKKDTKAKKKDKNNSVMRVGETQPMSGLILGAMNTLKDRQTKVGSMKPKLKKKLTLDDDDFLPLAGSTWMETKQIISSPKEESNNHNKQALDRIDKCLGDRQIKVSGNTAMKQSFKGGLTNEIKMQALRMARKGSKEFDLLSVQPGGYFEGLADLDYGRGLPYSQRELNIRKPKDLIVDTLTLGSASGYADELGPYRSLHIKTEVSISAEKKTSPYHSPTKIPKVVFGLPKKGKSKAEPTNAKKSPKRRSTRSGKPNAVYSGFHSAVKNSSTKEVNRSLEKKETRQTVDHSTLRTPAGAKVKSQKIGKVYPLIISNYGEAGLEGSNRGSNFSSTLIAAKSVQEYASVRIKQANRTNPDKARPRVLLFPDNLSFVGLEPANPVVVACRLSAGLKQLNRRVSRLQSQRGPGSTVNQPKDVPEGVYPSRPEYPDVKPLPFNLGDVRTVQQIPSLPKSLQPIEPVPLERGCVFLSSETDQTLRKTSNRPKAPADSNDAELIENELSVPMEKPFPPPEESTTSLYSQRGRVRPIIGCRPGSNIAVTKIS